MPRTKQNLDLKVDILVLELQNLKSEHQEFQSQSNSKLDRIITILSDVMGELQKIRDEQEIISKNQSSFEKRISKVETHLPI